MEGVIKNAKKLLDQYDITIEELRNKGFTVINYNYEDNPKGFNFISREVQKVIKDYYITF